MNKPHLRSVDGQLVEVDESPIARARRRFGREFAHHPDTTWRPLATPLLTAWLAERQQRKDVK